MKPGDLVKFRRPTSKQNDKVYLVIERDECGVWFKLAEGPERTFHYIRDLFVVNSA